MAFRSISVELGVNTANYSAGLRNAAQETRSFAASVDAAGKKAGDGFRVGEAASEDYATAAEKAATATKKAETNIAALARRNADLRELALSYKQVADQAEQGSARQLAATRLLEVSNKRLAGSGMEVAASSTQAAAGVGGIAGMAKNAHGSYLLYAAAAGTAAKATLSSIHAASSMNETQSKSVQVFGASSTAIDEFSDSSRRSVGLSKQASTEAAATFGTLLRGIGQTQPKAAEMSEAVVRLAADLASFSELNTADVLADIKSGLVGEAEPMRKHGVLLNEAAVKAEAYASGIARAGEELTEQQKVQARYNLILEQTSIAQGDRARTSESVANREKTLAAVMSDVSAELGKGLLPIYNELIHAGIKVGETTLLIGEKMGGLGRFVEFSAKAFSPLIGILDLLPGGQKKASDATEKTDEALQKEAETALKTTAAVDKHNQALEKMASEGGLSVEALTAAIGYSGQVGVESFEAQEAAAKSFLAAVDAGVESTSKAFMKSVDAVGHFSTSNIAANAKREASATKSSSKIVDSEDKVADAVERVADIQASHAEKAAADREAYAEKVADANENIAEAEERLGDVTLANSERMADAEERRAEAQVASVERIAEAQERYADVVESSGERVTDAQERLSDVVISSGERVAEADQRYSDVMADNKERVSDAEERYADIVITQNERIADADQRLSDIRVDAAERVQDAKDRLAEDRESGQEAIRDAERRLRDLQTRDTSGTPEQRAERARQRDIQRAREDLEKTRRRAAKTDQENVEALAKAERERIEAIKKAQEEADDARKESVEAIAEAEENLAKARADAIKSDAAAQAAADEARQEAVEAVAEAEEALAEARKDSVKAIAEAEEGVNDARTEGTKAVQEAEEGLAEARKDSARASQEAEEGLADARRKANELAEEGATIGVQTRSQARELEKAMEAVAEAQAKAGKAGITASEEQIVAIAVTTEEMKAFYEKSLAEGERFSEGIRGAIKKGYDPGFISRLLQAGPAEAAPILNAIAGDHDNSLRDLVNASERAIDEMNFHIREVARLTFMATHATSDEMNRDFSTAMAILEQNSAEGGKRTAAAIAHELGLGVEDVSRIAGEFGITLADGINPLLEGLGAKAIAIQQTAPRRYQSNPAQYKAEGGTVDGVGDSDTVPAMLTPGEFVFSKRAVQRIGVDSLREMHDTARRGYHEGGFVYPEDVPQPPDTSMFGNAVGYSGSMVNKKAYDEVVAFVRAHPPAPKGGGGGGYGYQALIDYLNGLGVDNQVTSTLRPGSITSSGNVSLHSAGLAADFVSRNMRQIFDTFLKITPSLQELFYDPAGFSVKRGQRASFTVGGHSDHVHAATWGGPGEGPGVPGSGAAVEASGSIRDWINQAMPIAGAPEDWREPLYRRAMYESGGRNIPQAITDVNSKKGTPAFGPMQVIEPTFRAHAEPGYGDWKNPVHNIAAAINYIESRYGSIHKIDPPRSGYHEGGLVEWAGIMDQGGFVNPGFFLGMNNTGAMEELRPTRVGGDGAQVSLDDETIAKIAGALSALPQPVMKMRERVVSDIVSEAQYNKRKTYRRG